MTDRDRPKKGFDPMIYFFCAFLGFVLILLPLLAYNSGKVDKIAIDGCIKTDLVVKTRNGWTPIYDCKGAL